MLCAFDQAASAKLARPSDGSQLLRCRAEGLQADTAWERIPQGCPHGKVKACGPRRAIRKNMEHSDDLHLVELSAPISAISLPWAVAVMNHRREKTLGRYLLNHRIDFFLPLLQSTAPLFPGFLFVAAPAEMGLSDLKKDSREATGVPCVLSWIQPTGYLQTRLSQELLFLSRESAEQRTARVIPEPRMGVPVRIASGPFMGLTGLVEGSTRSSSRPRMMVQILTLGQWISCEIDRNCIELDYTGTRSCKSELLA